jgi:hypothetical protein
LSGLWYNIIELKRRNVMNQRNYNLGPRHERELVVTGADLEDKIYVYTSIDTLITKLDKLVAVGGAKEFKVFTNAAGEVTGIEYELPRKALSFRDATKKREISEEQRAAISERFKKMREKRMSQNQI